MSDTKVNKYTMFPVFAALVLIMLILSFINIRQYFSPIKVLGVETTESSSDGFWSNFLSNNPDYVPGWLEIGEVNIAKNIDPNFNLEYTRVGE